MGGAGLGAVREAFQVLARDVAEACESAARKLAAFYDDTASRAEQMVRRAVQADEDAAAGYKKLGSAASRDAESLTCVNDPVDVATGDVVLVQADVELAGVLPLVVARAHRSGLRCGRWLGRSWVSTLDQRLEVSEYGVFFAGADGSVLSYRFPPAGGELVWPSAGARWPLARDGDSYVICDPQTGTVRRFEPRLGYELSAQGYGELPLVSVTSRAGHRMVFEYDLDGAPVSVTHDGGYQVKVEVAAGQVVGLVLAGGGEGGQDAVLVRYAYDGDGNLAEVVNSSGTPLRFSYDLAGRLAGWADRNSWWYRYRYDGQGRCVRTEGPGGALTGSFGYDSERRVTTYTDDSGAVTEYQLTVRRYVAAQTDPLGGVTTSDYDSCGQLVSRADPLGRVTRWAYDQAGNLTALTRADGSQATVRYNGQHLPVLVTGPDGAAWQQDFDERGCLVKVTGPDGAVTGYGYDGRGNLASVTDPLGAVTVVESNPAGLLVALTRPDGATTRYERDGFGRVTAVTDPDGRVTRLAWTTEGLLASRVFPDGSSERFGYDGEQNLTEHVDAAGGVTRLEYGFLDQVTARTGPDGTRTEFGYDQRLQLTSVTHAGLTWRYEYDLAGQLVAQTDYNGAATRFTYDRAGQLTSRVNAAGQQLRYTYDLLGNQTEQDAGGVVTAFSYDPAGRLTQAVSPDAFITLERDTGGRVVTETCNGRTVRSGYDPAGQRVQRVTPSGAQTRWDYNLAGLPAVLSAGGQELRFSYDQAGHETRRQLPAGATLTQQWDTAGQLAAQVLTAPAQPAAAPAGPASGPVLQHRSYTYRSDGLLTATSDLLSGPRRLTLDRAGQITAVTGPGWAENYSYDPAGNITTAAWPAPAARTSPGPRTPPSTSAGAQGPRHYGGTLLTRAGDIRYEHDPAGRITLRQHTRLSRKPDTWRYEWDASDRLTTVTTPDGTRWNYTYDPLGRRIAKQRLNPAGQATTHTSFTWDGPVLAEQTTTDPATPAAAHTTTWDHQPGTFTPLTQAEHWATAPQNHIDHQFYAIITDLIGTPAELITEGGDLAGHQQHTLWGTTHWTGATTPLRFPGQYADNETGLHYNHHRYYDPTTGRYLTPDPLGLTPAPNPHTYVPNPTTQTDPHGLAPCKIADVPTRYGPAVQSTSAAAMSARTQVENGAPLYRIGTLGKSDAAEGQFWALEHPATPGFAARYGIPPENVANYDFMEKGQLVPGTPFVTRVAPPVGTNPGGGIEAVTAPGGVRLTSFSTLGPKGLGS
jgi:RHS repeat-associated protein